MTLWGHHRPYRRGIPPHSLGFRPEAVYTKCGSGGRPGPPCKPFLPSRTPNSIPDLGRPLSFPIESPSQALSLSLRTRQEEDLFSQGEGPAVLVPSDLGAGVSTDVAGQGDAAVEGGGDLLRVQTCDSWRDCPRGATEIKKDVTIQTGREPTATG